MQTGVDLQVTLMPAKPQRVPFLRHGVFISLTCRQKAEVLSYTHFFCAAVIGNSILVVVWCRRAEDWDGVAF